MYCYQMSPLYTNIEKEQTYGKLFENNWIVYVNKQGFKDGKSNS